MEILFRSDRDGELERRRESKLLFLFGKKKTIKREEEENWWVVVNDGDMEGDLMCVCIYIYGNNYREVN